MESTAKRIECPQCGAPVTFGWSGSVQSTCRYCGTVLLRTDLEVERLGRVADLPPDPSPIQIGTQGAHRGRAFTVVGKIVYEYELGRWNEWHLLFADQSSGWLSDAQLQYALTRRTPVPPGFPADPGQLQVGDRFGIGGDEFHVASITEARFLGVAGELPFREWGRELCRFVDLRSSGRGFATLDYSEDPALLYLGESVGFEDLDLRHVRRFEGW